MIDDDKQQLPLFPLQAIYVGHESEDLTSVFSGIPAASTSIKDGKGNELAVMRRVPAWDTAAPGVFQLAVRERTGLIVPSLWRVGSRAAVMLADLGRCYSREHLKVLLSVLVAYRLSYEDTRDDGGVFSAWLWVPECLALLGIPNTRENRKHWCELLGLLSCVHIGSHKPPYDAMGWRPLVDYRDGTKKRRLYEAVEVIPSALLVNIGGDYHWPLNMAAACRGDTLGIVLPLWLLCASQWRAAAKRGRELHAQFELSRLRQQLGIIGQMYGPSAAPIAQALRVSAAIEAARNAAATVGAGLSAADRDAYIDAAVDDAIGALQGVKVPVSRRSDPRAGRQLRAALDALTDCGEVLKWEVTGGALERFGPGAILHVWGARSKGDVAKPGAMRLPTTGLSLGAWMRRNDIHTAVDLADVVGVKVKTVRRALKYESVLIPYRLRAAIRRRFCPGFPGD